MIVPDLNRIVVFFVGTKNQCVSYVMYILYMQQILKLIDFSKKNKSAFYYHE